MPSLRVRGVVLKVQGRLQDHGIDEHHGPSPFFEGYLAPPNNVPLRKTFRSPIDTERCGLETNLRAAGDWHKTWVWLCLARALNLPRPLAEALLVPAAMLIAGTLSFCSSQTSCHPRTSNAVEMRLIWLLLECRVSRRRPANTFQDNVSYLDLGGYPYAMVGREV